MLKIKKIYLLLAAVLVLGACTTMKKVMPYYTEPGKLAMLENGMSLNKIISTLGVDPYDVYHIQDDGSSVVVFTYRIKKRKLQYSQSQDLNDEPSQTEGQVWYEGENKAYILLQDGKLTSLITDNGRKDSKAILIKNNLLQLISTKALVDLRDVSRLWDEDAERPEGDARKGQNRSGNAIVIPLDKLDVNSIEGLDIKLK